MNAGGIRISIPVGAGTIRLAPPKHGADVVPAWLHLRLRGGEFEFMSLPSREENGGYSFYGVPSGTYDWRLTLTRPSSLVAGSGLVVSAGSTSDVAIDR
jgi:hypothetical protein